MDYDIKLEKLTRSFGDLQAVAEIDLDVARGELFGLIGPDGSGKTTLIRIMVGLIRADRGKAVISGFDVTSRLFEIKRNIGYLSQRFSLYPDLTVIENIRFYADLFQVEKGEMRRREQQLLAFSRLEPFSKRRAGALSGGMKQKLALCCTLIHIPRILFLDEPTTGVDPVSRREFWDLLEDLRNRGTTIFVSTAYMDEAARCDRVGLMYAGKLMAVDAPDKIPEKYPYHLLEVVLAEPVTKAHLLESLPGVRSVQVFGDRLHVGVDRLEAAGDRIAEALEAHEKTRSQVREITPGLEDVFVELIK